MSVRGGRLGGGTDGLGVGEVFGPLDRLVVPGGIPSRDGSGGPGGPLGVISGGGASYMSSGSSLQFYMDII